MIIRRFIVPLTLSAISGLCTEAAAQGVFPAPLPNQSGGAVLPSPFSAPALGAPGAPHLNQGSVAPWPYPAQADQRQCRAAAAQLREDAMERAGQIKLARERRLAAREACHFYKRYIEAEARFVSYVETRQSACVIPTDYLLQLKTNQKRSNDVMKAVCAAADDRLPVDQSPFRLPPGQPLPDQLPFRVSGRVHVDERSLVDSLAVGFAVASRRRAALMPESSGC